MSTTSVTLIPTETLLDMARDKSNQIAAIKDEIRAINRIVNARTIQAKATAAVAVMSAQEREAVKQVLFPDSIASAEKVGW